MSNNNIKMIMVAAAGLFLAACGGMQPIHKAALDGNLSQVRTLVDQGNNVNARSAANSGYAQYTPLALAIEHGHSDVISYLLDHGADVNAATATGNTPLHVAAYNGLTDVIKLLLGKGANVHAKMKNGVTPLHMAAIAVHDNIAAMRMLLDNGADVNAGRATEVGTPLEKAAYYGNAAVAEFLFSRGAEADARDSYGGTALHMAAKFGRVQYAQTLLVHHSDVNAQRKDRATPLHWAAVNGRATISEMLIDNGASVTATNDQGETPLEVAVNAKFEATVALLKTYETGQVSVTRSDAD